MKLIFQAAHEGIERIKNHAFAFHDHMADLGVDDRAEYDGPKGLHFGIGIDMSHGLIRFLQSVDERNRDLVEINMLEVNQQALSEGLRRDGCACGNEKYRAACGHGNRVLFTLS